MKYFGVIFAIVLLSAIAPARSCSGACSGQINILGVNQVGASLLGIDLQLVADVDLNLLGLLAVDVNAVVASSTGSFFVGSTLASFQGHAGEIVTAYIDVGNSALLVDANLDISLGGLHVDLDLDLDIVLGGNLVGNLLAGVLELVDGLLDLVGGLLAGLLGSNTRVVNVGIVGVQQLQNNQLLVSLMLQNSCPGGLWLNLNVDILNTLGIVANIDTQTVYFSGQAGQIVSVVVDASALNAILDANVFVQVSLGNVHLNLNLNVDVVLSSLGLNDLLDCLFRIVYVPVISTGNSGNTGNTNTGNTNTGNTGNTNTGNTGNTGNTNTGNTNTGNTGSTNTGNTGNTGNTNTGNTNTGNTGNTGSTNTGNTGNTNTGSTGSSGNTNTGSVSTVPVVIQNCVLNPDGTLGLWVMLDSSVNLASALSVDLNLMLFNSYQVLFSQPVVVNFQGLAGEVAYVAVDLGGLNVFGNVFVALNLLGLNLALDLDLNLSLNLVGGLFSVVDGLLCPILSIL